MAPELKPAEPARYAAFKMRFRAFTLDASYCLGLFVVGGIATGILLESNPAGRVVAFLVILAVILGYEPFMVARYGGTFGHRKNNIRIISVRSDDNLPFWRAALRSFVKQIFGLPSFLFMFVTSRAQGLHDLLAGARVVIQNPSAASESDFFRPESLPAGQMPSGTRRFLITLLYNFLLICLLSVVASFLPPACLKQGFCSDSEHLLLSMLGGAWLVLAGLSIVLGWMGRLPGCRLAR